jgi:hypothetical protein
MASLPLPTSKRIIVNISTVSHASALTSFGVSQTSRASDPDGDGDGGGGPRRAQGARGHGAMQQAMLQALSELGLSPSPASATSGASSSSTNSSTDQASTIAQGNSSTGSVGKDMRHLMHALFQALKGAGQSADATAAVGAGTASASTDPAQAFSSRLSALISQVSSGSAPSDLQTAFATVVSDLQGGTAGNGSAPSSSTTSGGNSTSASAVTLQAFLSRLQQDIGYGGAPTQTTGNVISASA